MNIKETMKEIYEINKKNGFWDKPVEVGTRLMLITSELAEALEADREGRMLAPMSIASKFALMSYEDKTFKEMFGTYVKDTFEDELADAAIRIFDVAQGMNIDLEFHIKAKMRYNSLREYKHGKKY